MEQIHFHKLDHKPGEMEPQMLSNLYCLVEQFSHNFLFHVIYLGIWIGVKIWLFLNLYTNYLKHSGFGST